ncbi:hypothetical protein FB567DRAFT_545011 [Paraphoma chrysanthemicola]|uniref:C2H2-type domain-containing protein n=1 Tax=Paraphoma chrysanthemicola TaxID=798071 RepID=A0A8K0W4F1_9PLEO|nr:hypothetical protein FB567DRAFT_545011 [Paraphoma chrysanthemicola]
MDGYSRDWSGVDESARWIGPEDQHDGPPPSNTDWFLTDLRSPNSMENAFVAPPASPNASFDANDVKPRDASGRFACPIFEREKQLGRSRSCRGLNALHIVDQAEFNKSHGVQCDDSRPLRRGQQAGDMAWRDLYGKLAMSQEQVHADQTDFALSWVSDTEVMHASYASRPTAYEPMSYSHLCETTASMQIAPLYPTVGDPSATNISHFRSDERNNSNVDTTEIQDVDRNETNSTRSCCASCGGVTPLTHNYIDEPSSSSGEYSVACPYRCGVVLTGAHAVGNLTRHLKTRACTASGRAKLRYPCPIDGCTREYSRSDGLRVHMRKQHVAPAQVPRMQTDKRYNDDYDDDDDDDE